MKKILKLNFDTGLTTECWSYYLLAIILSKPELLTWYIEKFINIRLLNNFNINYYSTWPSTMVGESVDAPYIYDEVLSFTDLQKEETESNLITLIVNAIDQNQYIHIQLDHNYCTQDTHHRNHDLIIYGYDLENQSFYLWGSGIGNKPFGCAEVSFDSVVKGHFSALNQYYNNPSNPTPFNPFDAGFYRTHGWLSAIAIRNDFCRDVCIGRIYDSIVAYINGGITSLDGKWVIRYGHSVYQGIYLDMKYAALQQKNLLDQPGFVFDTMRTLQENKLGLLYRLRYLKENIELEYPQDLETAILNIADNLEYAYQIMAKYRFSFKKKYLEKAALIYKEAEQEELGIYTQIKKSLEQYMRKI